MRAAEPTCEISCDIGDLCAVPGDPALLRQVWTNLLGNAAKFSRSVPSPHVEVRCEQADDRCRYTVRDNGVGFDPAYVDKLFKPFSRLHPTAEFEGTGIGLADRGPHRRASRGPGLGGRKARRGRDVRVRPAS